MVEMRPILAEAWYIFAAPNEHVYKLVGSDLTERWFSENMKRRDLDMLTSSRIMTSQLWSLSRQMKLGALQRANEYVQLARMVRMVLSSVLVSFTVLLIW